MNMRRKSKPAQTGARQRFLLSEKTGFTVQEAYKSLRTNIMFSLPGSGCKCIGVTSPTPGDGKSTTAANLAISMSQIGKRVLLIDCDMRLPTVASCFRIAPVPGLSDFLVGQAPIEEVVRNAENFGLHIMPAGSVPPDSTGLLEDQQLESLFTAFRQIYDYVIVDLPPVTTVPDAAILSKQLDGYLLVVREKQTRHRDVQEMLKQLRIVDGRILGFVSVGGETGNKKYYQYRR